MEAYEICQPCITAVREFGLFEWFLAFLFFLFTIISLLTRINIFTLLKTVGETMDKALNASKKEKEKPQTVKVEGAIDAVTVTEEKPLGTPDSPGDNRPN